jgi:hypothetical protein
MNSFYIKFKENVSKFGILLLNEINVTCYFSLTTKNDYYMPLMDLIVYIWLENVLFFKKQHF